MRRLIWIAATVTVLVGAGIAVAHENNGKSIKQVSATFAATTASNVRTDTCTATDGTYVSTRGDYTGTATSTELTLSGNATVSAESVINTTTGYGIVDGRISIDTADGHHTDAEFDAVYTNGHIAGLAEGHGHDSATWNQLVANLSADYSATGGGFANGKLGGTAGGDAVLVSSGSGCQSSSSSKPETIDVRGAVTAFAPATAPTSITAAGVSCVVPTTLAATVAALHIGDRVELQCTVAGGVNTLVSVNGDHNGGDNNNNHNSSGGNSKEHHSVRHH
jgi:hypothetical protein